MTLRWKKIAADYKQRWRRTATTLVGLIFGFLALGAIFTAFLILLQDLDGNFLGTNPANIEIVTETACPGLAADAAAMPGVIAAEERPAFSIRIESAPDRWHSLVIEAVEDFSKIHVARFRPISGAWPPGDGEILLERDGRSFFPEGFGKSFPLRLPDGREIPASIAGLVADPAKHPSHMEMALYGFVSRATLDLWSLPVMSTRLLVTTAPADAEQVTERIETSLTAKGVQAKRIDSVPRPVYGHQFQIDAILVLLAALALVGLLLCVVLTDTLVGIIMTGEQRSIGVMRALGATSRTIATDILSGIIGLGLVAGVISVFPAQHCGVSLARVIAGALNFDLLTPRPPLWLGPMQLLLAAAIPALTAFGRVRHAVMVPIHAILAPIPYNGAAPAWVDRLPPTVRMAVNGLVRKPRLTIFSAAILSCGLIFFMTALDLRASMVAGSALIVRSQPYDIGVRLRQPVPIRALAAWVTQFPEIARSEFWSSGEAGLHRHGRRLGNSTPILAIPADSAFRPKILAGRWLDPAQPDGIVVSQKFLDGAPNLKLGDALDLHIAGEDDDARIIGIAMVFGGAQIYALAPLSASANLAVLTLQSRNFSQQLRLATRIEATPFAAVPVAAVTTAGLNEAIVEGHLQPLTLLLLFVALLALAIGGLGMGSAIAASIAGRFREIAVMKAIGGKPSAICKQFVLEAILIATLGWVVAMTVTPGISRPVNRIFGNALIQYPFDYTSDLTAALATLAAAVAVAVLSCLSQLRAATRMSVHEALRSE